MLANTSFPNLEHRKHILPHKKETTSTLTLEVEMYPVPRVTTYFKLSQDLTLCALWKLMT